VFAIGPPSSQGAVIDPDKPMVRPPVHGITLVRTTSHAAADYRLEHAVIQLLGPENAHWHQAERSFVRPMACLTRQQVLTVEPTYPELEAEEPSSSSFWGGMGGCGWHATPKRRRRRLLRLELPPNPAGKPLRSFGSLRSKR